MIEPFSVRANMTTGGIARGGRLACDGERLVFGNHAADRLFTGDADWSVALSDVEVADVAPAERSLRNVFSGAMRSRLRVRTTAGDEAFFVVPKPAQLAEQITGAR